MPETPVDDLYVLIMAGGRGTRFWPLSRKTKPKQCLALWGGQSMLAMTLDRVEQLVARDRILVVTGRDMEDAVREVIGDRIPTDNVLVEPTGRNTAPAIGWGAVEIGRRGGGSAIMAVLPSDHLVQDTEAFEQVIIAAAQATRTTNALVTLGMNPSRPETGYGYLELGVGVGHWNERKFFGVERFVEKPNRVVAQQYLDGGRHLWNAGMFVFTVDALRDAFRAYLPETAEVLEHLMSRPDRVEELWPRTEAISIDYGVMERSRHIFTIPCEIGWSDMGAWTALEDVAEPLPGGVGVAGAAISESSDGNIIHVPDKVVALLGVRDLLVVDSPDVLLVADKRQAQRISHFPGRAREAGLDDIV